MHPRPRGRAKWTRELVVSEIRRWKDAGCLADCASVSKHGQYLYVQARRFFGSWDAACEAAGIGVPRVR